MPVVSIAGGTGVKTQIQKNKQKCKCVSGVF
jgi:hypothetical protein